MTINKYYTVSAVVENVLSDCGEETTHLYQKYLKFAMDGFREMNMEFSRQIKTVKLPMNNYKAINLPNDYIDYVKVAIQVGERLICLGVALDLALSHNLDDCGNPLPNSPQRSFTDVANGIDMNNYGGYWMNNFNSNSNTGALFAFGGGLPYKESFRENREAGQIQFTSQVHTADVYLEYISDGFDPTRETYINPYCYEYLRCYIHWRRVKANDNAPQSLKDEKGIDLHYAKMNAKGRMGNLSIIDIVNSSRKYNRMTIHA